MGRKVLLLALAVALLVTGACLGAPERAPSDPTSDAAPVTGDSGPPASCDDLFSGAFEYMLCDESPETCSFITGTPIEDSITCASVCESFGAPCVTAWDAPGTDSCAIETEDDCAETHESMMCVCERT